MVVGNYLGLAQKRFSAVTDTDDSWEAGRLEDFWLRLILGLNLGLTLTLTLTLTLI